MSQESEASNIDLENLPINFEQAKAQARADANDDFEVINDLLDFLSETNYTVGEEEAEITAISECKTFDMFALITAQK